MARRNITSVQSWVFLKLGAQYPPQKTSFIVPQKSRVCMLLRSLFS